MSSNGQRRPGIAVVDYRAGNITSLMKGLTLAGADAFLAADPGDIYDADAIVIPGVGHFAATGSIAPEMRDALQGCTSLKPILGICLGLQYLFYGSEEAPDAAGLELLHGRSTLLRGEVKVPHVGWNSIAIRRASGLLDGIGDGAYFYFTHSYAAPIGRATVATSTHAQEFTAVVDDGRKVFGVQFHPEKSGADGLRLLRNFVGLC